MENFFYSSTDRTDRKRPVLSSPDASLLALRVSAFAPPIKANRADFDSPKKIGKTNPFSASLAAHPATLGSIKQREDL